jgi:hypothetical protein
MAKNYTEKEVVELLKKFDRQYTHNTNSDEWYVKWINDNEPDIEPDVEPDANAWVDDPTAPWNWRK